METQDVFLSFNGENEFSTFTLRQKIAERSRIVESLYQPEGEFLNKLTQLQRCDDSIINELLQDNPDGDYREIAAYWQREAVTWKQQAEQVQYAFNQFRATHF